MNQRNCIEIEEYLITKNLPKHTVEGTKITFHNRGTTPVTVGLLFIMPGQSYQVNYEHPHVIRHDFSILFQSVPTVASSTTITNQGLTNGNMLLVQTMKPKC